MSNQGPRYATVGDYLRVMRRRRRLIFVVLIASVTVALGLSLTQQTEYTAEAQVTFRDPLQDLVLIGQGGQVFPDVSPIQRATIQADLLTRPEIAEKVRDEVGAKSSAETLADAISTRVDPQTNLVRVSAVWGNAEFAASLANAFAREAAGIGVRDARVRLRGAERALRQELRDAQREEPLPGIRISIIEQNLQRIRGLQSITDPAEVVQEAEPPSEPSAPRPTRNTVLGGILGLVLAIVAAFVRDALDRRLHNAQEVHDELGLPILGRIGESAFAHPGLAAKGRPPPSEADFEAFRVLRMNLGFLGNEKSQPRSVLVTSPLPEEGKSTVSISLASAAALAGSKVVLVECDLRRPSFSNRLPVERSPGLSDFLEGSAEPADILRVVDIQPPGPVNEEPRKIKKAGAAGSFVVIPAGSAVGNAPELLQSKRFESFLEKIKRAYDLVILDGSPLLAVADPLELAADADAVLLCVRVQQTTRDQVHATRSALSHLPERPYGVVVTGLRRGDETYEYYYGY